MSIERPNLCFIGHMIGRNPGFVTTQGMIAADLFSGSGHVVCSASSKVNRFLRLTDMIQTIIRHRRSTDVAIVEVYGGQSFLMADVVSWVSKYTKTPLVGVLHGGSLPEFTHKYPRWTTRVLNRFDKLVAPSSYLAKEIGRQGLKTRVIPNIVDLELYPFRLRGQIAPKLLWMRSFHPTYNPAMALQVFAIVRRVRPDATMVMAGVDKGLEDEVKNMAAVMGLDDAVRFPGFLDMEAKIKEFAHANVYLNTNRIDNMPVSVIEACAMGLPVVATNVGGLSELITDGSNGLLVPDGDAEEMAKAIFSLLNDRDLTMRISRNGRALAERSSWASVKGQWNDVFAEVLGEVRTPITQQTSVNSI